MEYANMARTAVNSQYYRVYRPISQHQHGDVIAVPRANAIVSEGEMASSEYDLRHFLILDHPES